MTKSKKWFDQPGDIKVGVVGYGGAFNMGKAHLQGMLAAGMKPFAVCEIDPARLEVAKEDFPGIETYSSLSSMLKESDVNLIVHITPHNLHYKLAAQCLRAGKHVVTEKPFVLTTNEADKLIDLAAKNKLMVSTYHNRHWDGWIMRAKMQIVDKGVIGDVYRAEVHMGGYNPPKDWWRTSKSISGGVLYDWGVHLLEYALQVVQSEIVEVSGFTVNGHWESKLPKKFTWLGDMNEDDACAIVRFRNGAMLNLSVSHLDTSKRPPIAFFGTRGSYTINKFGGPQTEDGWTLRKADAKGKIKETSGGHMKSRGDLFYKNIAKYLCGTEELIITPEWARRPIHILDLAGKSAKQNKALKAKHG